MAINPLNEPMMEHSHKPRQDDVFSISEGVKFLSLAAAAAPCQPSSRQPVGGNRSMRDISTCATKKAIPRMRNVCKMP